jgi:hypothetical protein
MRFLCWGQLYFLRLPRIISADASEWHWQYPIPANMVFTLFCEISALVTIWDGARYGDPRLSHMDHTVQPFNRMEYFTLFLNISVRCDRIMRVACSTLRTGDIGFCTSFTIKSRFRGFRGFIAQLSFRTDKRDMMAPLCYLVGLVYGHFYVVQRDWRGVSSIGLCGSANSVEYVRATTHRPQ